MVLLTGSQPMGGGFRAGPWCPPALHAPSGSASPRRSFRAGSSFTQYEPDELQPHGQVPFAGLRMRCRCPASPVPVVPARLGMLGAAVAGWLLLLNGVRCAKAVTGSNNVVRMARCFMGRPIARPTNNVNMAGPTRNYSPDRVV